MIISAIKIFFVIIVTVVLAITALLLVPFDRNGRIYHAIGRLYGRSVLAISGVKLKTEGLDRLAFDRNYVYVCNHASLFDIPSVQAGIPDQIRIVYKKELEKIPIFGWVLKYGRTYISIDRGKGADAIKSLEAAAKKIRNGASVLLFPEGTRSSDGKLQPFRRGAFNLAVKAGVPVVPVTINGSYNILRKGTFNIKPGTITLVLDTPIIPPADDGKTSELQLMNAVHTAIEHHYVEQ